MTATTWHHAPDFDLYFAETDDPRVLAVIQRDTDPLPLDGDYLAPAFWMDYPHDPSPATPSLSDPDAVEIALAWQRAHAWAVNSRYLKPGSYPFTPRPTDLSRQADEFADRYLRVFHDTEHVATIGGYRQEVHLFSTPAWRKLIGLDDMTPAAGRWNLLEQEAGAWTDYLEGDSFGIGYAVNEGRVLVDGPLTDLEAAEIAADLAGDSAEPVWDLEIECWGFLGEEYAKDEAASFAYGEPKLHPLLSLTPAA